MSNTVYSTERMIIFNDQNIIEGTNNSMLRLKFSSPLQIDSTEQIALSTLNMYYSWFNISASQYNNNVFQYRWFDASGVLNQVFTVTIPDGLYTIDTLNEKFKVN